MFLVCSNPIARLSVLVYFFALLVLDVSFQPTKSFFFAALSLTQNGRGLINLI